MHFANVSTLEIAFFAARSCAHVSGVTPLPCRLVTEIPSSFREQVALLTSYGVLVAPHSPLLMNLMFMVKFSAVIEIFPPNYDHNLYPAVTMTAGLGYYPLHATNASSLQHDAVRANCQSVQVLMQRLCSGLFPPLLLRLKSSDSDLIFHPFCMQQDYASAQCDNTPLFLPFVRASAAVCKRLAMSAHGLEVDPRDFEAAIVNAVNHAGYRVVFRNIKPTRSNTTKTGWK